MVILCFPDGHTERHPDRILGSNFAHTPAKQTINILTPEETFGFANNLGMKLDIGYSDPRKENC